MLVFTIAGCGGGNGTSQNTDGGGSITTGADNVKIGLVTDLGGLNDQSYNAAANQGLEKAKAELGVVGSVVESTKQEDFLPNLSSMVDGGNDLIWGIGFAMHDAMKEVAASHPNQKFAIIDSVVEDAPNVASITFRQAEGSFLVGVIAAQATQTKMVGFIGGAEAPIIAEFEAGFRAGVKSVDPSIQVQAAYAGSFTDAPKGKQMAQQMYGAGVDVIFHAAGGTGNGVIEAAKQLDKYVIGVDSDQNHLAPDHVITSMMKKVDVAVFEVTKQTIDGNFPGGQIVTLGLKEDGVGYAPSTRWNVLPEGSKELVDKYAEAIKDAKIVVPTIPADVETFTSIQF